MGRFSGQVVVVTGGASGIGEAVVRAVAAQGGNVLIADIQEELGARIVNDFPNQVLFQRTDITQEADVAAAIARAQSTFGHLTGLVNSAGIVGVVGPIAETPVESFDRTMAILARGVFLGIKHAARAMEDSGMRGAIVSLASTAGVMGGQGPHTYTMAKHGVVGLTRSVASELSPAGIRVNAVAPGGTVTPMTAALTGGDEQAITEFLTAGSPLGFACLPEDVANGILFLLSDEARFITGHTLVIDAGITTSALQTDFHGQQPSVLLHNGGRE
jgi:NAD(P)-dependent dehydrogenase (short-subunit alcohol dehydrogenase family)